MSNAITLEESEGLPFGFRRCERLGAATLGEVLSEPAPRLAALGSGRPYARKLPLDGDVLEF